MNFEIKPDMKNEINNAINNAMTHYKKHEMPNFEAVELASATCDRGQKPHAPNNKGSAGPVQALDGERQVQADRAAFDILHRPEKSDSPDSRQLVWDAN